MRKLAFFGSVFACVYSIGFGISVLFLADDAKVQWFLGLLCAISGIAYGMMAYERRPSTWWIS